MTLAPQQSVQFPITAVRKLLLTVGQQPTVLVYTLPGRGYYTLVFDYSYTGPNENFPNVYHGTVTSMPVTVLVK